MQTTLATLIALVISIDSVLAAEPDSTAHPNADPPPAKLVIMSWNVEWMFDDNKQDNRSDLAREQSAPSHEYWQWKVNAVADAIAKCDATVVALQEIEGSQTLADIIKALRDKHQLSYRAAFIQGSDNFTEQDVGILQRSGLVHFRRHEQSKAMFDSQQFYNLSKHVVSEFQWRDVASPLTVMNVHMRATVEAESERTRQGKLARYWVDAQLSTEQDVVVLGDFNSEHAVGDLAGEMKELIEGSSTATQRPAKLVDLLAFAPQGARRTHLILDKQFDRILVSNSLMVDDPNRRDWVFDNIAVRMDLAIRGAGSDGKEHWDHRLTMSTDQLDVSDHAPVVATFELR